MQSHIYDLGLINGQCSDIRIRAFGRIYHLHRLLLIQSGFFRAMLCGGYAEDLAVSYAAHHVSDSTAKAAGLSSDKTDADADVVELCFDDPNISRAAFEYCIARLYGDGPKLILPFWSNPYDTNLLTSASLDPSEVRDRDRFTSDPRAHPATPRLLLSLLATSIYLNIPSITSQALTLVLCSVTPFTVTHYLRFAIGRGIQGARIHSADYEQCTGESIQVDEELEESVRTLEQLARPCAPDEGRMSSPSSANYGQNDLRTRSSLDDLSAKFWKKAEISASNSMSSNDVHQRATSRSRRDGRVPLDLDNDIFLTSSAHSPSNKATGTRYDGPIRKEAGLSSFAASNQGPRQDHANETPDFHYGLVADKIGEACVCWYAQKGVETFFKLESVSRVGDLKKLEEVIRLAAEQKQVEPLLALREHLRVSGINSAQGMQNPNTRQSRPRALIWSYPSLPSTWVRQIICSDSFFVRSEWERYEFAKGVVEFRRQQKAMIRSLDRLIETSIQNIFDSGRKDDEDMGNDERFAKASKVSQNQGENAFGFKSFGRRTDIDAHTANSTPCAQGEWADTSSASDDDEDDEDEIEYEHLFTSGIYYSHMSFQELNKISRDVSPITGTAYTPLHVLQAALWVSNELRNHVLSSPPQSHGLADTEEESAAEIRLRHISASGQQEADAYGELGISSALTDFRRAVQMQASSTSNRHARSRSTTPFSVAGSTPEHDQQASAGLGGIGNSPLSRDSGGMAGLLEKRYHMVTSDDTVRFGDGLVSIISMSSSAGHAGNQSRRTNAGQRGPIDKIVDDLGPTGYAIAQMPHTVPIEVVTGRDVASITIQKRQRDQCFGMVNDVAIGRQLGENALMDVSAHASPSVTHSTLRAPTPERSDDPTESGDGSSSSGTPRPGERWTAFEPMRVGVEFFGIDKLQEKQRLYSPTFFYAGSIWNLYIQLVRKTKGVQLGVYLHRQSPNESLPPPSAPFASEIDPTPLSPSISHVPLVSNQGGRRRADQTSPTSSRRAARPEDLTAAAARGEGAHQPQPSLASFQNDAEPNSASFFDASMTGESPLRSGANRQTQIGASSRQMNGAGSSVSLPGGRTLTSIMSFGTDSLFNDEDPSNTLNAPDSSSSDDATPIPFASAASTTPLFPSMTSTFLHSGVSPTSASVPPSSPSVESQPRATVPLFPGGPAVLQACQPPAMPYRDPRKELRAYFSIHCPSPLGNALTKFSSGPDKFTNSQSWGWKSSSLLGAVYLEDGDLEKGGKSGFWPRFRCVCTIGLV